MSQPGYRRGGGGRGRGRGRNHGSFHGGGGRGRGNFGGRDREEGSERDSDSHDRPPPHLKGKQIGLWYAARGNFRGRDREEGSERDSDSHDRPPPHLKGKQIGLWHAARGSKQKTENLPKMELADATKIKITSLIDNLKKEQPKDSSWDSDFFRRYKQNLFDNAAAAAVASSSGQAIGGDIESPEMIRNEDWDILLKEDLTKKESSTKYQKMMSFREKLPAYKHKEDFVKLISQNQVIVVSGETGCGKTTQCCQLILDEMIRNGNGSLYKIICTQPRRISAITVAERVAEERDERVGDSTGYCIRLESRMPSRDYGSILFCTTGVVFQYLKNDPLLRNYSHILVDEIHERDVLSDFLLAILKELVKIRRDLKVVLMSATINADRFSRYFGNCPTFHIPGFTYPVEEYFLEDVLEKTQFNFEVREQAQSQNYRGGRWRNNVSDEESDYKRMLDSHLRKLERERTYPRSVINELRKTESEEFNLDLIEELLRYICTTDEENGAILIFVPGWDQISKLNNQLRSNGRFPESRFLIIPLHSLMPTVNQKEVFNRPPAGKRKIIIATNIAETSITIDDIVFVIDTGKIKMTNYDTIKNIESLDTEWVSLANATQRKGRAGRVQSGVCYHLYNRARQMTLESFKKPEVLRKRLEEVVLQIKMLKLGSAAEFLRRLMDPPSSKAVDLAVERLRQLNAIDDEENLTPLGFHLAHLPMDPHTGKMILMAAIFGCVDPVLTVAASLSFKDGFYIPLGQEKNVDRIRKQFAGDTKSDHLVTVYAMKGYESACWHKREREYCYNNFLSLNTMQLLINMKRQFAQHLYDMKFIPDPDFKASVNNTHSENTGLIKAVICAGLYPNIATVRAKRRRDGSFPFPIFSTYNDGRVDLHLKSVNVGVREFQSSFFMYYQKLKSKSLQLFDTTMISPFPLIFFGGELKYRLDQRTKIGIVSVDKVADFQTEKSIFEIVQDLRLHLDRLLKTKINNPGPTCWDESTAEGALLSAITQLITAEYREMFGDNFESDDDE